MHTLNELLPRRIQIVFVSCVILITGISGCTYLFEDSMKGWVGVPLTEFQEQYRNGSRLISVTNDKQSGQTIYAYDLAGLDTCAVYWYVDSNGKIVNWKHVGRDCHKTWP